MNPYGFPDGYYDGSMAGSMMPGVVPGAGMIPGAMGPDYGMYGGGMMPQGDWGFPQQPVVGYPQRGMYQQPVGRVDSMGYVHYTRQQMLDGLRNYVITCTQGRSPITKEEKIEETPQFLRHACAECGVSRLQMLTFNIPEVGVQIPFYFCTACGKLFYYKDFYR